MSASIYWHPIKKGTGLGVGAASSFLDLLERGLGQPAPYALDESQIVLLRGMAAGTEDKGYRIAIEILIEALEKHGKIEVWAEY